MIIKNTCYIMKSDEGKYLVVYLKPTEPGKVEPMDTGEDNPLYHYHIDNMLIAQRIVPFGSNVGYKVEIKVFLDYHSVMDYLNFKEVI